MSAELATVFLYSLQANELEAQITNNLESVNAAQKYSSNEVAQIHLEANCEEDMIRNEIAALDDQTGDEYEDLMDEIRELKEEVDDKVEVVENRMSDFETNIQLENDRLEAQLEHCNQNHDAYKELAIQNAQDNAGYFQ